MKKIASYDLASAIAPRAITSSTDATPIVVKAAATHGYTTGDIVTIVGHTTNTNANGTWVITVVDTDDFSLDGSTGTGGGAGGTTGTHSIAAKRILVQDADHVKLTFDTDGGGDAAFTVKAVGNHGTTYSDYGKVKSPTNRYEFLDMVDDEDAASVDGDTGFVVATADDNRSFTVNVDAMDWLSVIPTAGTAGELTVSAYLYAIE